MPDEIRKKVEKTWTHLIKKEYTVFTMDDVLLKVEQWYKSANWTFKFVNFGLIGRVVIVSKRPVIMVAYISIIVTHSYRNVYSDIRIDSWIADIKNGKWCLKVGNWIRLVVNAFYR